MNEPIYTLEIVTPQGIAYTGRAAHTLIPVNHGYVGVLAHHAPYLTASSGGRLTIREGTGLVREFTVGDGFFEINENRAVFLTKTCAKTENGPV